MVGQVVPLRDSPQKKKEDSIAVLVCRIVPEAVLTCRSSGCTSTLAYFRWILILLGHTVSCSLHTSVSRLIALRSWRLCHPRSFIISEKLDFYDNRFSHSVQHITFFVRIPYGATVDHLGSHQGFDCYLFDAWRTVFEMALE